MRCLLCQKFSIKIICKKCQESFLQPSIKTRDVNGTTVVSFYNYSDIEELVYTKYDIVGSLVYDILAKNSFKKFAKEFSYDGKLFAIPIDDYILKSNFSHSAILAKNLKSTHIKPQFNKLISKNRVKYAKATYEYRLLNPREFCYKGSNDIDVILVDDVVTTGLTITEAVDTIRLKGANVEFAMTLTDARDK
jgi:competence protein ComFC